LNLLLQRGNYFRIKLNIMSNTSKYNIYCDESCHLEHDHQKVMVLGAVWCPAEKTTQIFSQLREIKTKHGFGRNFEIKWTKISPAKTDFYLNIVNYFFDEPDLHFRGLVVTDKDKLKHKIFNQDHDTWYYKMYFHMLNVIFFPDNKYRIYLDIKDTRSSWKLKQLHDVLCNNIYDFSRNIIESVQTVRSHEVGIIQLADLFIGALAYVNRNLDTSEAKVKIVDQIKQRAGYTLENNTLIREEKFNLFFWNPKTEKRI